MDRTLIQFYHCNKDIYCFSDYFEHLEYKSGLLYCPACFGRLKFNLLEAPVSIPCPFTNGHNVPCAFNIGSMLGPLHISEDDYSELHIGITDSKGLVYNYTLAGIRRDACGWEQCISVPLVQPDRNGLKEQWDRELEKFSSLDSWAPQRFYEERKFGSSCYGFALSFINHVRAIEGQPCITRDEFTGKFVLPRIKITSKYIKIYKEITKQGFYVADK
ncbi:MKRN2 opposite strand protein [Anguilla anguilla]|nr:MKRN2 opposite strand protein [Anguilla anguilla]